MKFLLFGLGIVFIAVYLFGGVSKRMQGVLETYLSWYSDMFVLFSSILEMLFGLGFIRQLASAAGWQGERGLRTFFILVGVFFFLEGMIRFIINKKLDSASIGSLPVVILTYPLSWYLKKKELC